MTAGKNLGYVHKGTHMQKQAEKQQPAFYMPKPEKPSPRLHNQ